MKEILHRAVCFSVLCMILFEMVTGILLFKFVVPELPVNKNGHFESP